MRKSRQIRHGDIRITIYPKTETRIGKSTGRKKRRQTGGFLNRYDFAYAGRDVVNQVGKIAPGIINRATGEINKIAQQTRPLKQAGQKSNESCQIQNPL